MKKNYCLYLLMAISSLILFGCKKDALLADNVQLQSFSFDPSANPGLKEAVLGTIEGQQIHITVPNSIDITKAIPSFHGSSDKLIAYVGQTVQESGISAVDFTKTVVYRFVTPDGMSEYSVTAEKAGSIVSFGFYASDNPEYLFRDYPATITKLDIKVDLPVDADVTKLVARYTKSNGTILKYNGTDFVSKETVLDYTLPQNLELQDVQSGTSENFVVTVGRLTAPVWSTVQLPDFLNTNNVAEAGLAINPVNRQPYVSVQFSGSTDDLRKGLITTWNADTKQWETLGANTGFTPTRADLISLDFSKQGIPYVAFRDYTAGTNAQYASLMKYENSAWSFVGNQQSSFNRVNYLTLKLDENDIPYQGYVFTRASSPYPNRGTYVESFNGSTWSGQTFAQSSTGWYAKMFKGGDSKLYYVVMDLTSGTATRKPSVYRLDNGVWNLVGNVNVGPAESNSGGINIDLDVTADGQIYMVYQSNSPAYKTFVMHWNGSTWKQFGDGISQSTSSSANRDNVAISIHPDGRVFLAYGDAINGIKVCTFNESIGNWNAATQLSAENGNKFVMKISKEGIPYLITVINNKAALFKYDIPGL
ncbi:hypothetical protein ABE426_14040 [Sphingobacterium faecium]|uniref:hypothetical protein n=1 Tax=Sphingobacterium faecium TaxID=34087 RepID=UPI0032095A94